MRLNSVLVVLCYCQQNSWHLFLRNKISLACRFGGSRVWVIALAWLCWGYHGKQLHSGKSAGRDNHYLVRYWAGTQGEVSISLSVIILLGISWGPMRTMLVPFKCSFPSNLMTAIVPTTPPSSSEDPTSNIRTYRGHTGAISNHNRWWMWWYSF